MTILHSYFLKKKTFGAEVLVKCVSTELCIIDLEWIEF